MCNHGIELVKDPTNESDPYAVKVVNCKADLLGYIPRYYAKKVSECMEKGYKIHCQLIHFQKNSNCNECIHVSLEIE